VCAMIYSPMRLFRSVCLTLIHLRISIGINKVLSYLILLQALLRELTEHSEKVEALTGTLRKLIADNPDSPEADTWRQQLQELGQWRKTIPLLRVFPRRR